jgi:molybdate/tungstate transport system permease protein
MVLAYYPMTAPVKIYDLYLQSGLQVSSAMAVLLLLITLSTFLMLRARMRSDGR